MLEPVIARYRGSVKRLYFRGDAAFGSPKKYKYLEAEGIGYTMRLPTNRVLQDRIGCLLKRLLGRPPHEVRRYYPSFSYRMQSWNKLCHAVAKVVWHPGELYPHVGFIVSNLPRSAEGIVALHNKRDMAKQWIKEGKDALKWMRFSCCTFAANAVCLQVHARAYNSNFLRTLAVPKTAESWSLTSLREKPIKIGEGCQLRALGDVPDGRGRGATTDVRRHPIADHPVAHNTYACMSGAAIRSIERWGESMSQHWQSRRISVLGGRQQLTSLTVRSGRRRFAVVQVGQQRNLLDPSSSGECRTT